MWLGAASADLALLLCQAAGVSWCLLSCHVIHPAAAAAAAVVLMTVMQGLTTTGRPSTRQQGLWRQQLTQARWVHALY